MEFEEMKKIWDTQSNSAMYAIDESVLRKSISKKASQSNRIVALVEVVFIIINLLVGPFLIYDAIVDRDHPVSFVIAGFFILGGIYTIISQQRRISRNNSFGKTMIGELDDAIANADYLIVFSRKVIYWYNIPVFALIFMKLTITASSGWVWLLMLTLFSLAFVAGRWELNKCHYPRKERLQKLKAKILALNEQQPLQV